MIEATIGLGEYSKTLYRTLSQWDYGQVTIHNGMDWKGNVANIPSGYWVRFNVSFIRAV